MNGQYFVQLDQVLQNFTNPDAMEAVAMTVSNVVENSPLRVLNRIKQVQQLEMLKPASLTEGVLDLWSTVPNFLGKFHVKFDEEEFLMQEYNVATQLNELRRTIPNFVYMMAYRGGEMPFLVEERVGGLSLEKFILQEDCTFEVLVNLYLQVLLSISMAFKKYGFFHGDLHTENVVVRVLEEPIKITYETSLSVEHGKGSQYVTLSTKYVATIIDFDQSKTDLHSLNVNPVITDLVKNFDSNIFDVNLFSTWLYVAAKKSEKFDAFIDWFERGKSSLTGGRVFPMLDQVIHPLSHYDFQVAYEILESDKCNTAEFLIEEMINYFGKQQLDIAISCTRVKKHNFDSLNYYLDLLELPSFLTIFNVEEEHDIEHVYEDACSTIDRLMKDSLVEELFTDNSTQIMMKKVETDLNKSHEQVDTVAIEWLKDFVHKTLTIRDKIQVMVDYFTQCIGVCEDLEMKRSTISRIFYGSVVPKHVMKMVHDRWGMLTKLVKRNERRLREIQQLYSSHFSTAQPSPKNWLQVLAMIEA